MKRVIFFILTLATAITIFALSSQNDTSSFSLSKSLTEKIVEKNSALNPMSPPLTNHEFSTFHMQLRDIAHIVLFLFFSFFLYLLLKSINKGHPVILCLTISFLYALFDESYQGIFITGRSFEFVDLLKDFSGSIIGLSVAIILLFTYKKLFRGLNNTNLGLFS